MALFQVGPLTFDDQLYDLQEVEEKVVADFAKHELIDSRRDYEFSGPGEDPIELGGHLVPFHMPGLADHEVARALCTGGAPVFVVRGDGAVRGWHQIMEVKGRHKLLSAVGVGFEVETGMRLERCRDPGADVAGDLIGALISLFE